MTESHTVVKEFKFSAAHRLVRHEGLCKNIHGHNYVVRVAVTADKLDHDGMVTDFAKVKATIGKWIDDHWDHALIRAKNDEVLKRIVRDMERMAEAQAEGLRQRVYVMAGNPTAENMAKHLYGDIVPPMLLAIDERLLCTAVVVCETDTAYATVQAEVDAT